MWVCGHEAIHIGPYLQHIGIEGSSYDSCGVVGASASEGGGVAGVEVAGDKAWHYGYGTLVGEGLLYLGVAGSEVDGFVLLAVGEDKLAGVVEGGVVNELLYYQRAAALAIAEDGIFGLGRDILNEIDATQDARQLVKQVAHLLLQGCACHAVSDDGVDVTAVEVNDVAEQICVACVAFHCQLGDLDQVVGNGLEGGYNHNDWRGLCLYDGLYVTDAFYGTY